MRKNYPEYHKYLQELVAKLSCQLPGPMAGFATLHATALASGALTTKVKELIALGIAIAVHCDGCISYHIHDALKAGASKDEILETIGVAVLMGGGPSMVYGAEAFEALNQYEAEAALELAAQ